METDVIEGGTTEQQEAMDDLYRTNGHLTTGIVLDAATDPTSPLHDHFTWDDVEAAHAHRLQQAGSLIRKFKIVRPLPDGRVIKVHKFTRVDDVYRDTREVVTEEGMRDRQRLRIISAIERLRDELAAFDEFADLVAAIDHAINGD